MNNYVEDYIENKKKCQASLSHIFCNVPAASYAGISARVHVAYRCRPIRGSVRFADETRENSRAYGGSVHLFYDNRSRLYGFQ